MPKHWNERRDLILRGLLEDSAHFIRYQSSPTFRFNVDTLVQMLPSFLDGFAASAARVDAEQALAKDLAMKSSPAVWLLPDGTVQSVVDDPSDPS